MFPTLMLLGAVFGVPPATVADIPLQQEMFHACANEPPGFEVISDEPFEEVPPVTPQKGLHGWSLRSKAERQKITLQTDPLMGSAVQATFPAGAPGGRGPFLLANRFARDVAAIYMCITMKLDPRWTNNGNVGTKWGFFLTPYTRPPHKVNHFFNLADRLGIQLQSGSHARLNRNVWSRFNVARNLGRWLKVEILVRGNSLGRADGTAQMWVNGQQVLNEFDIRYFFPEQQAAFSGVTWNPTYGGGHNPVPYDMHQWIAHWYISGQ